MRKSPTQILSAPHHSPLYLRSTCSLDVERKEEDFVSVPPERVKAFGRAGEPGVTAISVGLG